MRIHRTLIALAAAAIPVVCPSMSQAQSPLNTVYLSTGNSNPFGWFDLQVHTPVKITSLDLNFGAAAGTAFSVNVYITAVGGVCSHNTTNPAEWMLVASGSGTAAGSNLHSLCDIGDVMLTAGTYGVAVECTIASRHASTGSATFSTAELTLTRGGCSSAPFGGTASAPRTWNGSIHYVAADGNATGACCLSSGVCQFGTFADCGTSVGTFRGEGVACAAVTCLQPTSCCKKASGTCVVVMGTCNSGQVQGTGTTCAPGACPLEACCAVDGASCTNITRADCIAGGGLPRGAGTTCGTVACGAGLVEVEPNETKADADANGALTFTTLGAYVRGSSQGSSGTPPAGASQDQFRLKFPAAPLAIYRNRLVFDTYFDTLYNISSLYHSTSVRGRDQSSASNGVWPACGVVGTPGPLNEAAAQSSSVGLRDVQWYSFGKEEEFYYRVSGNADTPLDYIAAWTRDVVTPVNIGNFAPGTITINTTDQGHTTNTDLWVYDAMLDAIDGYGNDGASTNGGHTTSTTTPSFLRREYVPGTYYLALSNANIANNKGSPCDDQVRNGSMLDFPNVLVNSSFTANLNVAFAVTDANGTTQFPATKTEPYQALWFRFTVGAPSGVCCRGATCTTAYTDATACTNALPVGSVAGAAFVASGPCNASGNNTSPCCHADYNKAGGITVQDIFDCLNDWFAGSLTADVGGDGDTGTLTVQDIFEFLNVWFAGGC